LRLSAFVIISLLFLCWQSCGSNERNALVTVGDETLYEDQIALILGKTEFTEIERDEIIEAWINMQLAQGMWDSLSADQQQLVELRAADYKGSLILFELENSWIEQQLDTLVSEEDLKKYYEEHIQEFLLNDYIVKLLYLKIPSMAPDIELIRKMYLLNNTSDTAKITQYANQYASAFYYNNTNWISFEDFLKELPVDYLDVERFVTAKTKKVFEENGYLFFINIIDYRLKNTPSPFTFEKERIRYRIILNRKLELRQKAKEYYANKLKNHDEIEYHFR